MIKVEAVWMAVEPLDMRSGTEAALARVVTVFGAARPHHAYLFANRRANRMKVLVHDGIGVWLAARRLNSGKFAWPQRAVVERHIRGKWVCKCCERITQAPVAPHVIDKGRPTTGLLAQVLVAKYLDHLPLYRQEAIFERAGHLIARSTLAQWVGECGVQLQPLVDVTCPPPAVPA